MGRNRGGKGRKGTRSGVVNAACDDAEAAALERMADANAPAAAEQPRDEEEAKEDSPVAVPVPQRAAMPALESDDEDAAAAATEAPRSATAATVTDTAPAPAATATSLERPDLPETPARVRISALAPPGRAHPRADPGNDTADVASLRGHLQRIPPGSNDALRVKLAQRITAARYPLDRREQAQLSRKHNDEFHERYGGPGAAAAARELGSERVRVKAPPVQLEKHGKDMTDSEAIEARDKLVAEMQEFLVKVDEMKATKSEWQAVLEAAFEQEAQEDDRARELFKEVMTSEAFFLGDRQFREWMANREDAKVGVGAEGIALWYDNDALLECTPFIGLVPYPRNLTGTGRREFADKVDEIVAAAIEDGLCQDGFHVRINPLQAHHTGHLRVANISTAAADGDDANADSGDDPAAATAEATSSSSSAATSFVVCRSGADVLDVIDGNPWMSLWLDRNPVVFLSPAPAAPKSTTFRVDALVAGGDIIAVETHTPSEDDSVRTFRKDAASSSAVAEQARRAAARAVVERFAAGVRPQLEKRTYLALFEVTNFGSASEGDNFSATLLNIGELEPRDMACFKWTEIVGLIAMALNTVRRMETAEQAAARERQQADVDALLDKAQVRGDVHVVVEDEVATDEEEHAPAGEDGVPAVPPPSSTTGAPASVGVPLGDENAPATPPSKAPVPVGADDSAPTVGSTWLYVSVAAVALTAALVFQRRS